MFSHSAIGIAAHDRVAVVAVLVHGVHAVGGVAFLVAEELVLARRRPVRCGGARARCPRPRTSCRNATSASSLARLLADLVQHQPPVELRQALVDVVGDDRAGGCGSRHGFAGERSGSIRIACRLLQEKTFAAASRHGSQVAARCSRGATRTGCPRRHGQAEDVLGVVGRSRARSDGAIRGRSRRRSRTCQSLSEWTRASRPVSSITSRTAVCSRLSPASWLPVTDCQNPGWSARSSSSTFRSGVVDHDERRDGDLEAAGHVTPASSRPRARRR